MENTAASPIAVRNVLEARLETAIDNADAGPSAGFSSEAPELHEAYKQLFRFAGDLQTAIAQRNEARHEMADAYFDTMYLLALAADFRQGRNQFRLIRIGIISEVLARALGQPEDYCRNIRRAAPLHDIGMVAIPDALLTKQAGLDETEWNLWRSHAGIGARMLSAMDTPIFRLAAQIALTHHENFHGNGYPGALAGRAIPLAGRIVALAEYYETHVDEFERPNGGVPGMVLAAIRDFSGRRFDPELVELFFANLRQISEARRTVETSAVSLQCVVERSRCDTC
jgi:putative two-component system response regulator